MIDFILNSELLTDLTHQQLIATLLVFIWTGFVRSGLGFGGAALGLPLMLIIDDSPLFWLPIIGLHLLFFTSLTLVTKWREVDWAYTSSALKYILPAKIVGVLGLLNLPNHWLIILIYSITLIYSIMWLANYTIKSRSKWNEKFLLLLGGYVSGTSLTGAPLMVAVFMQYVKKAQLKSTLFALWFILVSIKMITFAIFSVNLQIESALLLLPMAFIGHLIGTRFHHAILQQDALFRRITGGVLLLICLIGLSALI